ncbi:poly(A)-specific ribonuclease PARN-like [Macadamia integrifolia]|uniref:poly(A)-specific ribonuclease PARN-like n=1 Tax=Macadamia integrifolia TaxID=60698 RepID=UPI001C5288B7|nr:poly(A)-specific ribonuclease PARN-like [Macadamia integrifolia]
MSRNMKKAPIGRALALVRQGSSFTWRSFSSATSTFALKKVTKTNFDSALEDLRGHVRDADFVAIDLEMTGVTSAPWRESFEFDRYDVRYLKVKDSVEKFAVVQFGVCPFRWDSSKESFVAHPHNFYVFPRKELPFDGPCSEFLCQTTSIDFLAKYQFDFNACIHEGISYLSRTQEAEAWRHFNFDYEGELSNLGYQFKEVRDVPLNSTVDVLFTERVKNRFREWRDGLLQNRNGGFQFEGNSNDSKQTFQTVFFKMRPAIMLKGFTSHQLRLIQLVIRQQFKDLAYVYVYGEDSVEQKLVVYTDSEDDKHLLMQEVKDGLHKEAERKIKAAVGFRHVIDLLSSERKLLIGHNCFLDIAHIYSKFFAPLPSAVEEFVSSLHEKFPYVVDTKHLLRTANAIQNLMKRQSTSLSSAFAHLCPEIACVTKGSALPHLSYLKVEVQVDDMRSSNWNSGAKHEAGYDAFMTGCVFAQACSRIGIDFKLHSPSTVLAHNEKLQKYMNLLYLSWNNGAIIDLSSGKVTPESSAFHFIKHRYPEVVFKNIVLFWGFPSKLKPRELRECISKVFGSESVTTIYYLDKTASFIQFSKEEFVNEFLVLKETLERNNDAISVLHPFSKLLEGGHTHAANYEVYKEICSSAISRILFADQANSVCIKSRDELDNQELGSSSGVSGAGNSISSFVTKSESTKSNDVLNDPSYRHFSCDKMKDALYIIKSQLGKQSRNTKL